MIGKKIRELAEKRGLSLKDLAYKSEIAEPTLHNILTRNDAKMSQLDKIAEILGVSTSYFTGEIQENKVSTQKNEVVELLKNQVEEQKSTIDFLKNLVNNSFSQAFQKLDNLEKLGKYRGVAFGSDGGALVFGELDYSKRIVLESSFSLS